MLPLRAGSRGIVRQITTSPTSAPSTIGTKAARHPKASISSPPRNGPAIAATVPQEFQSPSALPRSLGAKRSEMTAMHNAWMPAVPVPCTTLPTNSIGSPGAKTSMSVPARKTLIPARKSRRLPTMSESLP